MPAKLPSKGARKASQKRAKKTPSPSTPKPRSPATAPPDAPQSGSKPPVPSEMPADLAKQASELGPAAILNNATEYIEDVKEKLEYQLAGKDAVVQIAGRSITFKKWGLRKRISLGSRVSSLLNRVAPLIPNFDPNDPATLSGELATTMMMSALSIFVEDVVEIIAQSISDPFHSVAKAIEWIDDELQLPDVINMAVIVYDQNLAGEALKNLREGLEEVGETLQARLLKK